MFSLQIGLYVSPLNNKSPEMVITQGFEKYE